MVFGNRVLWTISGLVGEDVTADCRQQQIKGVPCIKESEMGRSYGMNEEKMNT